MVGGLSADLLEIISQLAAHISLHHLFIIKVPLPLKSLDGVISDIIGITFSRCAAGETENGHEDDEKNE